MKTLRTSITVLLLLGGLPALLALGQGAPPASSQAKLPQFSDFTVKEVFRGKPARARITSSERRFRTVIRDGARKGPNFAGHFTITQWGCGTGCFSFVITDAKTGVSYWPPMEFVGLGDWQDSWEGLKYHLDSSLLIVDGCPAEEHCATYYYNWRGRDLALLTKVPNPKKYPHQSQ